jgi:hypothetical protein
MFGGQNFSFGMKRLLPIESNVLSVKMGYCCCPDTEIRSTSNDMIGALLVARVFDIWMTRF